jgi:hypothetical protein
MTGRRRFLALSVIATAFVVAASTAWALTKGDDSGPSGFVPTTGTLAQGTAPSGGRYEIFRLDPSEFDLDSGEALCAEIRTPAAAGQGCNLMPDEDGLIDGQPLRPSLALLGTDRFFTTIAPKGVEAMEVSVEGEDETNTSQALDAGPAGRLLVVKVGGPMITSRDPASSRDYEVRLLGANGETVHEAKLSDPR